MKKASICFFLFSLSHNTDFFRCKATEDYRLPLDSSSLNDKLFFKSFALKKRGGERREFGEEKHIQFLTLPIHNLILFIFPQFPPYSNPAIYLPYNPKQFGKIFPFLYIHTTLRKGRDG